MKNSARQVLYVLVMLIQVVPFVERSEASPENADAE